MAVPASSSVSPGCYSIFAVTPDENESQPTPAVDAASAANSMSGWDGMTYSM